MPLKDSLNESRLLMITTDSFDENYEQLSVRHLFISTIVTQKLGFSSLSFASSLYKSVSSALKKMDNSRP